MPDVVTESGDPHGGAPVAVCFVAVLGDRLADGVGDLVGPGDDVVDPTGQVHDPERVLEAPVGGAGVNHVGERQLMDVAQSLERWGVDDLSLAAPEGDEVVEGVPNLVIHLGHSIILPVREIRRFPSTSTFGARARDGWSRRRPSEPALR